MADLILFLLDNLPWLSITIECLKDGVFLVHTSHLHHLFLNTYVAMNRFGSV